MLSDWDTEWKYSDFALLAEMKVLSNRGILKQMIMKQMQHLKQTLNSKSRFELFHVKHSATFYLRLSDFAAFKDSCVEL